MSLKSLAGKNILITGGSRGIGAALVRQAARAKANVIFCCRSLSALNKKLCSSPLVHAMVADISSEADIRKLFLKIDERFPQLDIVINNAAIAQNELLIYTDLSEWERIIRTNLTSSFLISQQAITRFIKNNQAGSLVYLTSLAEQGAPSNAAYATSKGGLRGLTDTVNHLFNSQKIYANLVKLGLVETDLNKEYPDFSRRVLIDNCPLKRSSTPEEVAASILYVAAAQPETFKNRSVHITGGLIDFPIDFLR